MEVGHGGFNESREASFVSYFFVQPKTLTFHYLTINGNGSREGRILKIARESPYFSARRGRHYLRHWFRPPQDLQAMETNRAQWSVLILSFSDVV